ncbi:MAG: NAD-glutamate dehydrogenase domain-containing protein, partial [Gammaproteobacteria bacterium]
LVYDVAELAELTRSAWAFFAERKPGVPKVRFVSPGDSESGRLKTVSVVEVVNDDMPFLVDSLMGELTERGLSVRLVAHPTFTVTRDQDGRIAGAVDAEGGMPRESFIHVHVERVDDAVKRDAIVQSIGQVLADVRLCVQDWRAMVKRVNEVIAELKTNPPPVPVADIAEAIQFLEWLNTDNFTLLGVQEYVIVDDDLAPMPETGLGLLRQPDLPVLRRGGKVVTITPEIRAFFNEPKTLVVAKANLKSRVHRRVYMDYIAVKRFDADGVVAGAFRIIGLFTSGAYTREPTTIPYLRRKIDAIVRRAGFHPDSHSGKALVNVLETYPRDELFQVDEDTLYRFALAILQIEERPRVRVLARRDRFDRFVSVLVYAPRERYDTRVRIAIGDYLARVYHGRVSAFYPWFPEGPLVRVHFIIGRDEGETPNPDRDTLEEEVSTIVRTWTDALAESLAESFETKRARALFDRYRDAFSDGFREAYSPIEAVEDIRVVEGLTEERPLNVDFYHKVWDKLELVGLEVWSRGRPLPLSERVPVLENMGFRVVDERTYHVVPAGETEVWFHDMTLECVAGTAEEFNARQKNLEALFIVIMRGFAENDGYNALTLAAGLMWRDVTLVRAISRFLRQIRLPYSQDYMWATLRKHAALAAKIVDLFHVRFDPRTTESMDERKTAEAAVLAEIEAGLQQVESLDEDRIVRHFVNAVQAAIRTNYYQLDS